MKLEDAINQYWRSAEIVENAALVAMSDCRSKLSLETSRLMRGRLLDAQLRGARAESYVLMIPVEKKPVTAK